MRNSNLAISCWSFIFSSNLDAAQQRFPGFGRQFDGQFVSDLDAVELFDDGSVSLSSRVDEVEVFQHSLALNGDIENTLSGAKFVRLGKMQAVQGTCCFSSVTQGGAAAPLGPWAML